MHKKINILKELRFLNKIMHIIGFIWLTGVNRNNFVYASYSYTYKCYSSLNAHAALKHTYFFDRFISSPKNSNYKQNSLGFKFPDVYLGADDVHAYINIQSRTT